MSKRTEELRKALKQAEAIRNPDTLDKCVTMLLEHIVELHVLNDALKDKVTDLEGRLAWVERPSGEGVK